MNCSVGTVMISYFDGYRSAITALPPVARFPGTRMGAIIVSGMIDEDDFNHDGDWFRQANSAFYDGIPVQRR
jgi:hypothetical protein